jgi:hypothetical protein
VLPLEGRDGGFAPGRDLGALVAVQATAQLGPSTGPRLDLTKNVKRWCRERHARPDLWFMLPRALNHPSMAAAT